MADKDTSRYTSVLPESEVLQFISEKRKFKIKAGTTISKAFEYAKQNVGPTLVMGLIVSCVGVINYWLYAGAYMGMHDEKTEGKKFEIDSLFRGFDFGMPIFMFLIYYVLISFVVMIIPMGIMMLGVVFTGTLAENSSAAGGMGMMLLMLVFYLLIIIIAIALSTVFIFALHFIVFSGMKPLDAIKASAKLVRNNFLTVFIFVLACAGVNFLGALACGLGVLFTVPMVVYATQYAFEDIFKIDEDRTSNSNAILEHLI